MHKLIELECLAKERFYNSNLWSESLWRKLHPLFIFQISCWHLNLLPTQWIDRQILKKLFEHHNVGFIYEILYICFVVHKVNMNLNFKSENRNKHLKFCSR